MRNEIVVSKMVKYIEKIQKYTNTLTYSEFAEQEMIVEACIFNLSQLGELSNKVDKEFQENHPEIPWRSLYGLRNRIVHDYEGVNLALVWEIIENDLSDLKKMLKQL